MALPIMKWVAGGVEGETKTVAAGLKYGTDLLSAYSYGLMANDAREQGKLTKWQYDLQAAAYKQDASDYMATAGDYQQEGLDQAFLRYQQLNEDVGRIRATAAGSGIDMSSDIVRRVDAQTRQNAAYDVNKIGQNAANKSQSAVYQARNALINSAYATANGEIAKINADAQGEAYDMTMRYGQRQAKVNFVMGVLQAKSDGLKTAFG